MSNFLIFLYNSDDNLLQKPEIILHGGVKEEGFHILIDPIKEYIQRWSVLQVRNSLCLLLKSLNKKNMLIVQGIDQEKLGQPFDGTPIDLDEPFILR